MPASANPALNIVILAAGRGTRMRSERPKVLHAIGGEPLLAHVLATARALKPARICVVIGHGADAVRAATAAPDVAFAVQSPQLGTGHAVAQALPHLAAGGTTLVLYGDVPLVSAATLQRVLGTPARALAVLTTVLEQPKGYGRILRNRAGAVTGIVEDKDATPRQRKIREVNTGILRIPTARLSAWLAKIGNNNAQREYYLTDLVKLALADRVPVAAVVADDAWETLGANSKRDLAQLERLLQWRRATALMEAGVTLLDPMRIDIRGALTCGADVSIDVGCVFEGKVTLAGDVSVGANCVLRDVEVGAGTRIEPFSHLDGARVGARCRIGPYARIRPATTLAEDVHIGNFVEVKAATVGIGSKANHLAYVGDATVGARVNVGAGTITCNYDGANKHRTIIEDDVFIGSDTQLVAPVTIRRGATIGAGSTITKEAPADALTLSRSKQMTVPGWKRPQKAGK
jgi:bifunctional UDP-N-acetylglucosamine pyrophosphorylase/glucosamine-1-phosphate N-acetyltransferase